MVVRSRLLALAAAGALLALTNTGAAAAPRQHGNAEPDHGGRSASYFIEFRSRPGYLFGHTYIVYGRLDERGRPRGVQYAGIYPVHGQPGLVLGSVIPVPASVRAVKDDYRERPSNIYRRRLSAADYARLDHLVRRKRATDRHWNLLFANCNDFAIDIAEGLGMTAPPSWLMPSLFVDELRSMNESHAAARRRR